MPLHRGVSSWGCALFKFVRMLAATSALTVLQCGAQGLEARTTDQKLGDLSLPSSGDIATGGTTRHFEGNADKGVVVSGAVPPVVVAQLAPSSTTPAGELTINRGATWRIVGNCRAQFEEFKQKPGYSAFAAGQTGSCGQGWGFDSSEKAKEAALNWCRQYGGRNCALVATRGRQQAVPTGRPETPAGPPIAINGAVTSHWMHNDSLMRMTRYADGRIEVHYEKVRDGLRETISDGDLLLTLRETNSRLAGQAKRFKRGCSPAAYDVSGSFIGPERTEFKLEGAFPVLSGCRVRGYSRDGSLAELIFTSVTANTAVATANPGSRRPSSETDHRASLRPVTWVHAPSPNQYALGPPSRYGANHPNAEVICRNQFTTINRQWPFASLLMPSVDAVQQGETVSIEWEVSATRAVPA